MCTKAAVHHD